MFLARRCRRVLGFASGCLFLPRLMKDWWFVSGGEAKLVNSISFVGIKWEGKWVENCHGGSFSPKQSKHPFDFPHLDSQQIGSTHSCLQIPQILLQPFGFFRTPWEQELRQIYQESHLRCKFPVGWAGNRRLLQFCCHLWAVKADGEWRWPLLPCVDGLIFAMSRIGGGGGKLNLLFFGGWVMLWVLALLLVNQCFPPRN